MAPQQQSKQRSRRRRGSLTLEWILLATVIVIGVIGGLGAVRAAINAELIDLSMAIEMIEVLPMP